MPLPRMTQRALQDSFKRLIYEADAGIITSRFPHKTLNFTLELAVIADLATSDGLPTLHCATVRHSAFSS